MKILLVENQAEFVAVVVPAFLAEHEVTTVSSLDAARAAVAAGRFDAILADYDLDGGKGDAFVSWLSAARVATPVIAISSHDVGNAALAKAGAVAVCPKTRFDQIGAVLRRVVSGGGA